MTPGTYRRGGAGATIKFAIAPTPLGRMLVAATERGLCAVRFGESATELERGLREEFHAAEVAARRCRHESVISEPLLASVSGENTTMDLPLDVRATAFQKKVWETLRRIPRGETRSYTEIAREIGRSASSPRGGPGLRVESSGAGGAVSSRRAQRRRAGGISLGNRAQEEAAGSRTGAP